MRAELSTSAFRHLAPEHFQSIKTHGVLADRKLGAGHSEARISFLGRGLARLRIGEVDTVGRMGNAPGMPPLPDRPPAFVTGVFAPSWDEPDRPTPVIGTSVRQERVRHGG
jgi:hypothetical protein